MVSYLPAAGGSIWAIDGGNEKLASALLESAGVNLRTGHIVTGISRDSVTSKFSIVAKLGTEPPGVESDYTFDGYDAVIIATPLESSSIVFYLGDDSYVTPTIMPMATVRMAFPQQEALTSGTRGSTRPGQDEACRWVQCTGTDLSSSIKFREQASMVNKQDSFGSDTGRTFQTTITTYVSGVLQPTYFGVENLPSDMVLVANDVDSTVSAISPKTAAQQGALSGGSGPPRQTVFKVFSTIPLNSSLLSSLFGIEAEVVKVREWQAYPRFRPPETFAPFRISHGICYINTIENSASAMEMSAIGGINCALMAHAMIKE